MLLAVSRKNELALKIGWPSMFRAYLDNEARYRKCFADGLYLSAIEYDGIFALPTFPQRFPLID